MCHSYRLQITLLLYLHNLQGVLNISIIHNSKFIFKCDSWEYLSFFSILPLNMCIVLHMYCTVMICYHILHIHASFCLHCELSVTSPTATGKHRVVDNESRLLRVQKQMLIHTWRGLGIWFINFGID